MKKTFSLVLVCLLSISVMACSGHQFPRIVLEKEIDPGYAHTFFGEDLGEFDDLQEALDTIVDRYNATRDKEDLYRICHVLLLGSGNVKDGNELAVEYFSQFFNEIWSDENFNTKTLDSQYKYADFLMSNMYDTGRINESVDFFEKYAATIQDKNKFIDFNVLYLGLYYDDYCDNKSLDKNAVSRMLEWSKSLEIDYVDKVEEFDKGRIYNLISRYAEMLGDMQTAMEYREKATWIITKLTMESN